MTMEVFHDHLKYSFMEVLRLKAWLERIHKRKLKLQKQINFQEFCCKENRELVCLLQGNVPFYFI